MRSAAKWSYSVLQLEAAKQTDTVLSLLSITSLLLKFAPAD